MADFHFLRPYWFLALIPVLLLYWGYLKRQDKLARWREVIEPHLLEQLVVGEHRLGWFRPLNVLLACWVITTFAMAGPAWRQKPSPFVDDQAGLMVVLKVTESMAATDVQPSRLQRAKHKLHDLLELRQNSATGLIVYSGSAHLVMPLTKDQRIITSMAEDITPQIMPVAGDALAEAVALAERIVGTANVTGSLLIVADSVATEQVDALARSGSALPAQFLAVQSLNREPERGLQRAARKLSAPIVRLTVDGADVERINKRSTTAFANITGDSQERKQHNWQDAGYLLLPLIFLCMLLWFRRGWVVQ